MPNLRHSCCFRWKKTPRSVNRPSSKSIRKWSYSTMVRWSGRTSSDWPSSNLTNDRRTSIWRWYTLQRRRRTCWQTRCWTPPHVERHFSGNSQKVVALVKAIFAVWKCSDEWLVRLNQRDEIELKTTRNIIIEKIILRNVEIARCGKIISEIKFLLVNKSIFIDSTEDFWCLWRSFRWAVCQLSFQKYFWWGVFGQTSICFRCRKWRLYILYNLLDCRLLFVPWTVNIINSLCKRLGRERKFINVDDIETKLIWIGNFEILSGGLRVRGTFQRPVIVYYGSNAAEVSFFRAAICEIPKLILLNWWLSDFFLGAVTRLFILVNTRWDCFSSDARANIFIARIASMTRMSFAVLS